MGTSILLAMEAAVAYFHKAVHLQATVKPVLIQNQMHLVLYQLG
jgi:hypothetical protein